VLQKKVGIFESYDQNGKLSKILEYDLEGNEINSLDAQTYLSMKEKESAIHREFLVAKTTLPLNNDLEASIKHLADSLTFDFDSLMKGKKYSEQYEERFAKLSEQKSYFGNLSNKLIWYDSLLATSQDFTNELWSYSNELYDAELQLQKHLANLEVQENLVWLKENYTTTKKTLFGKKIIVINEQNEVYEAIIKEIYPTIKSEIITSNNKFQAKAKSEEFKNLVKKAASIIDQPNSEFQEALKNLKSLEEKKKLFLSLKCKEA
jgi:hypothetical protein